MARLTRIDLAKEDMKFSAGHFTLFDSERRERLHGHNFTVQAILTSEVGEDGLAVDYGIYKRFLLALCKEHNEWFLLPGASPYLRIEAGEDLLWAHFNGEAIPFRPGDVKVLPVRNVTLEELAAYLLERVRVFGEQSGHHMVRALEVKVSSGPGQSASAAWERP